MLDVDIPTSLIETLNEAQAVTILTGAGVSAESGIPTFRDAMTGLWAKYEPEQLASPKAFEKEPELVTRWYDERRRLALEAEPNPGHLALARLERIFEKLGREFTLVTQNVDRLHQRAGSRRVIEVHGAVTVWHCSKCLEGNEERGGPFEKYPPVCGKCGGVRRPAVVWFGEPLPPGALDEALNAAARSDLFLSVGTSAMVYPAAGLIELIRRNHACSLEINTQETSSTHLMDWSIQGPSGEVLPKLVDLAFA